MTRNTNPTARIRSIVRTRSGGICERCGGYQAVQQHHRRPRGMGGSRRPDTNTPSNLLDLCAHCHREVEADRIDSYVDGWLVRQADLPIDIPVRYRGELVLLDDCGGMTPTLIGDAA